MNSTFNVKSVSYTHLDVYKRQVLSISMLLLLSAILIIWILKWLFSYTCCNYDLICFVNITSRVLGYAPFYHLPCFWIWLIFYIKYLYIKSLFGRHLLSHLIIKSLVLGVILLTHCFLHTLYLYLYTYKINCYMVNTCTYQFHVCGSTWFLSTVNLSLRGQGSFSARFRFKKVIEIITLIVNWV